MRAGVIGAAISGVCHTWITALVVAGQVSREGMLTEADLFASGLVIVAGTLLGAVVGLIWHMIPLD